MAAAVVASKYLSLQLQKVGSYQSRNIIRPHTTRPWFSSWRPDCRKRCHKCFIGLTLVLTRCHEKKKKLFFRQPAFSDFFYFNVFVNLFRSHSFRPRNSQVLSLCGWCQTMVRHFWKLPFHSRQTSKSAQLTLKPFSLFYYLLSSDASFSCTKYSSSTFSVQLFSIHSVQCDQEAKTSTIQSWQQQNKTVLRSLILLCVILKTVATLVA